MLSLTVWPDCELEGWMKAWTTHGHLYWYNYISRAKLWFQACWTTYVMIIDGVAKLWVECCRMHLHALRLSDVFVLQTAVI